MSTFPAGGQAALETVRLLSGFEVEGVTAEGDHRTHEPPPTGVLGSTAEA